jgi:hypothetical protein
MEQRKIRGRTMVQKTKMRKAIPIRSSLIVAAAIATLGLGSPAFALGGWDNDTGNLQPSYYDKNGWRMGRLPQQQAVTRQPARPGRGLYLYVPGANGSAAFGAGGMSDEMLQSDWWWGGANPGH